MDLRAMECDSSSPGRRPCANEGLLVGCRCPSRKSLESFGSLPRTRSPTTVRACSDEVEEIATFSKKLGRKMRLASCRIGDRFAVPILAEMGVAANPEDGREMRLTKRDAPFENRSHEEMAAPLVP